MLNPVDTPTNINTSTPGSSSDALIHSQSISSSRAPQEGNYQLDDDSRPNALVAPSPQHITDGYVVPSTYTAGSPYRTPSIIRNPHAQTTEYSPSINHPQAYSPALSSNYIPPPSPTPSQLNAYPVSEGQYQQNAYQDPYQQTYHQTYQNQQAHQQQPTLQPYPDPALVDTVDEKVNQVSSVIKPANNNGHRKKIIWVGSLVILILIGAIIGIVVSKNKDSDNNGGNSSSDSNLGNGSSNSSTTPTPTGTSSARNPISLVPVTIPSTPVTVSSAPVTVPTPTNGGSSGGSGTKTPTAPTFPPQYNCPTFFCDNWRKDCENNLCAQDSDFKACAAPCNGEFSCTTQCEFQNPCYKKCSSIWWDCRVNCDPPLS